MKVKELIKALKEMPQDLEVYHLWDGQTRTVIEYVWLSRGGNKVVTADRKEVAYTAKDRPVWADDSNGKNYWETP